MKILHGPNNIGGMAGNISKAQQLLGVDAYSYCLPNKPFEYAADRTIQATTYFGRILEILGFFAREGLSYDIFQFYFGISYTGPGLHEISFLKRLGKSRSTIINNLRGNNAKRNLKYHTGHFFVQC